MFDFPNSPTLNQTATAPNGAVFVWDGAKWTTAENAEQNRAADVANVLDYGAKGNGITNDTAAFVAAMAASKIVQVPTGLYLLDPIVVPAGVALCGVVPGPMDPGPGFQTTPIGATLLVNSHGTAFITLQRSSGLYDVLIYDPGQVAPTAAAPHVFPAQVLMVDSSRVRGVTLCNAYIGIQVRQGRCWVENCYIGAYATCVDVDTAGDVTYFSNIWCGVFYDTALGLFPWQNMDNWVVNNNGVAFKFARADAVSMVNCGCYIKWAGLYCVDGTVPGGSGPSYGWCANFDVDMCLYGAVVYSANAANGWQFTNFAALPMQGGPQQAQTPLYMPTGGASPPYVNWTGGAIGLPSYWANPTPVVNAGQLAVSNVCNLADRLPAGFGLFGHAPVTARPAVTGAKGGNAALTSLLSALAAYGLVTDNST